MAEIQQSLGQDINKIGKITEGIKENMNNEISLTGIKQGLRTIRLGSIRGPDGITSSRLNYLCGILPNLIHGAIQEITLYEKSLMI